MADFTAIALPGEGDIVDATDFEFLRIQLVLKHVIKHFSQTLEPEWFGKLHDARAKIGTIIDSSDPSCQRSVNLKNQIACVGDNARTFSLDLRLSVSHRAPGKYAPRTSFRC